MAFSDAWTEKALITIEKSGGTAYEFAAITDDISINEGDRPGESIPNNAGGRIWVDKPQEDGEVALTMYPIELDTTSGVGLFQQYMGGTAITAEPLHAGPTGDVTGVPATRRYSKDKFRLVILWTNDTAATTATGATAASTDSLRFVARESRIVSHKVTFNPGEPVKAEVVFKFAAFTKAGNNTYLWQSADQTALVALADY